MSQFSYIKVALTEQNQQTLTTLLSYSDNGTAFMADAPVPGVIFDYFLNARDCFVQWTTREANYFALIFRNPFSTERTGFYMLTLCVDAGTALTGRETFRALTSLRKTLVEERRMSTPAIDETLQACGIPAEARSFESWHIPPTYQRNTGAPACYRTYVSTHELESYFTFPIQDEYSRYSAVIYVAATTSLRPGVELQHVLTPLRNVYTVVTPKGVESSRPSVAGGERIVITYTREGYSPIRETVVAGKPSAFVTYEGARMVVKPAEECRLTFTRRIPISVRSAKGGPVTGYTVTVNGRPVDTMQPYIEISDLDLRSGAPVVVTVNSNNFVTEKLEIPVEEVDPSRPISVILNPLEQGITLRLDFGEGRVFEMQISLEKNTPEYSQLHGGSFHGFRARRLAVPGGGEIYYIDVRSGAKPSAPAFDNVSSDGRPQAPHFDRTLPVVDKEAVASDDTLAETDSDRRSRRRRSRQRSNIIGIAVGLVVIAAIITAAVFYLVPAWTGEAVEAGTQAVELVAGTPADTIQPEAASATTTTPAPAPAPSAAPVKADAGDYAYLNANKVWVRDSLHTSQGQALYDAITDGDIESVVRNPYFATEGAATNAEAIKAADMMWGAFGASTQKSNVRAMQKLKTAPSIDLHELYETLARYRSPQPNTEPRPKN